ncbi:MAG: AraC family transcriptional regulator [Pseudobutyrivibrio sp.]|nr:AraC family transcriptional regulator [Pseudobutyrivibrio sp.]
MNEIIISNNKMPVVCESNGFKTTKGFIHPSRCLPFHVLLYVKNGTFYVTEENIDYEISSGSIFFMKAGLHHCGTQFIEPGTEWRFIHFYMDQDIDGLSEYRENVQPLSTCARLESYLELPKQLFDMKNSEITSKIEDVAALAKSDDPYKGWKINQKTAEILNDIAVWNRKIQTEVTLSDRIAQYLVKHVDSSFNADEIAAEFFLSYKHLAATFKKEKGISMQQYHNRVRMQRAAHILSFTGITVTETSEKLGFKDPLYFSRCFHQIYGISPSEYRKNQNFSS